MSCHCGTCQDRYCAAKVRLFRGLDESHIFHIVNKIKHLDFKKGDLIFSTGDQGNRLLIVNKGTMKVYNYTKDGKEQILYLLTEGDYLGDINLFKESIMPYYASALDELSLCTLSRNDFKDLLLDNPEINIKMLNYAYERITDLERLVQTLTTKDVDVKIATLLTNLYPTFGIKKDNGIEINLPINREDMANYLGLTRETVSRSLTHLQTEGIITMLGNKKIIINDYPSLSALSIKEPFLRK